MASETAPTNKPEAKIVLYWLEKSRSHRILWLLEELKVPYELKTFKRTSERLAPPELKEIHPLGKSPLLTIQPEGAAEPIVLAESAFITEYLVEHYGGWLCPKRWKEGKDGLVGGETEEWLRYRYYMHYAEGSLMSLLLLALFSRMIRASPVPFFIKPITNGVANRLDDSYINRNVTAQFSFLEGQMASSSGDYLCGKELTAADILMSFPLVAAAGRTDFSETTYPKTWAYLKKMEATEGYKRACEKIVEIEGKFESML